MEREETRGCDTKMEMPEGQKGAADEVSTKHSPSC